MSDRVTVTKVIPIDKASTQINKNKKTTQKKPGKFRPSLDLLRADCHPGKIRLPRPEAKKFHIFTHTFFVFGLSIGFSLHVLMSICCGHSGTLI